MMTPKFPNLMLYNQSLIYLILVNTIFPVYHCNIEILPSCESWTSGLPSLFPIYLKILFLFLLLASLLASLSLSSIEILSLALLHFSIHTPWVNFIKIAATRIWLMTLRSLSPLWFSFLSSPIQSLSGHLQFNKLLATKT